MKREKIKRKQDKWKSFLLINVSGQQFWSTLLVDVLSNQSYPSAGFYRLLRPDNAKYVGSQEVSKRFTRICSPSAAHWWGGAPRRHLGLSFQVHIKEGPFVPQYVKVEINLFHRMDYG